MLLTSYIHNMSNSGLLEKYSTPTDLRSADCVYVKVLMNQQRITEPATKEKVDCLLLNKVEQLKSQMCMLGEEK